MNIQSNNKNNPNDLSVVNLKYKLIQNFCMDKCGNIFIIININTIISIINLYV